MKSNIFALAILASALSVTLALSHEKIDLVHSQVMSYVQDNMQTIKMMRSSTSQLDCYDLFTPKINSIATNAKTTSKACIEAADSNKTEASNSLSNARTAITTEVQKIQNNIQECIEKSDNKDYFQCWIENVPKSKSVLETIAEKSSEALTAYNNSVSHEDVTEGICLREAVDKAKNASDDAFKDLKTCIGYEALPTRSPADSQVDN